MYKNIKRSHNKMIAGVCAGLSDYFEIDVTVVRVLYVLLSILSAAFPGILIYVILWILIPSNKIS